MGVREITYPDRASWLAAREGSLGGSEVAAALGLSPWTSRLELWVRLRGIAPEVVETREMRRGSALEEFVIDEVRRESGYSIRHLEHVIWTRDGRPGEHYSPDAVTGAGAIVEAKSSSRWQDWKGEDPPEWVWCQVQHGMDIGERDEAIVAVDLGYQTVWQVVHRDPVWERDYRPRIEEFLELVRAGTPPEPDGSESARRALAAMPRERDRGVLLGRDVLELVDQWDDAREAATLHAGEAEALRQKVIAAMGPNGRASLPDGSWLTLTRRGVLRRGQKAPRGVEVVLS